MCVKGGATEATALGEEAMFQSVCGRLKWYVSKVQPVRVQAFYIDV